MSEALFFSRLRTSAGHCYEVLRDQEERERLAQLDEELQIPLALRAPSGLCLENFSASYGYDKYLCRVEAKLRRTAAPPKGTKCLVQRHVGWRFFFERICPFLSWYDRLRVAQLSPESRAHFRKDDVSLVALFRDAIWTNGREPVRSAAGKFAEFLANLTTNSHSQNSAQLQVLLQQLRCDLALCEPTSKRIRGNLCGIWYLNE